MKQIFILIFTLLILTCVLYLYIYTKPGLVQKQYKQLTYFRYNDDGSRRIPVINAIQDVLSKLNVNEATDPHDASILFLDKFNHQHIFKLIDKLDNYKDKYLYTILTIDYISSKSELYRMMRSNVDEKTLHEIFPKSFLIDDSNDVKNLKHYMMEEKNNLIILKKNIQQQKGCKIIASFDEKELATYVIAQELLQNPFLIENRKINLRVYVLIKITNANEMSVYMYNDGFVYYTLYEYKANSSCPKSNLTSGLIDRVIYEKNPLTINDFRNYIGFDKTRIFNNNILTCFKKVFTALKKPIQDIESTFPMNKFVVMGADVAVDKDLGIKLMEINKGPDLRYKDEKDRNVKFSMLRDAFYELGLIDENKNVKSKFIKLI